MSGLGHKSFAVGEVLTSTDVNGYLMDQSVMRFDDAAARDAALGTAVVLGNALAEGMVAYDSDTARTSVYNGDAWVPVGAIVKRQVFERTTTVTQTFQGALVCDEVTYEPVSGDNILVVEWDGRFFIDRNASSPRDRRGEFQLEELSDSNVWNRVGTGFGGRELVSTSSSNAVFNGVIRAVSIRKANRPGFSGTRQFRTRIVPLSANVDLSSAATASSPNYVIVTEYNVEQP